MYEILRVSSEEWRDKYAANARLSVFGEILNPDEERIDYALLVTQDKELVIYTTFKELSKVHVYMCFGGSFPNARGKSSLVRGAFLSMLEHSYKTYNEITFHTKNTNYPMQKLSMHAGFLVVGLTYTDKNILLEYNLKKEI